MTGPEHARPGKRPDMASVGDYLTTIATVLGDTLTPKIEALQALRLPAGAAEELALAQELLAEAREAITQAALHAYDHRAAPSGPSAASSPVSAMPGRPSLSPASAVPPQARDHILALLAQRGPDGARRADLVDAVGKSRATVAKWLAALREEGVVTVDGATTAARYYLPQHHPRR